MSEVASLKLSKELFELTKWGDTIQNYLYDGRLMIGELTTTDNKLLYIPAYDLGYLIRKFSHYTEIDTICMAAYYPNSGSPIYAAADTPEDACCELLIKLIKEKVIKI